MFKLSKVFSKPLFTALFFLILSVILISLLLIPTFDTQKEQHKQEVFKKLLDKKAQIDYTLNRRVNYNKALSSFIEAHPDIPYPVFEKFVKSLISNDTIINTLS